MCRYSSTERYASGEFPNQRNGSTDTLDVWTRQNRSILDTDIVFWYSCGFHHVTLQENMPVLATYVLTLLSDSSVERLCSYYTSRWMESHLTDRWE